MRRIRILTGLAAALALPSVSALVAVPVAHAANSPTFRDCSLFAPGIDPDFVQLSGVTTGAGGSLTASAQSQVKIEASESADPGDGSNHVTLNVTVTAPGSAAKMVSGAGTGSVILAVPLISSPGHATTNTISWAATFDNGSHLCPSSSTPENTTPKPFVVSLAAGGVAGGGGGGNCDVPKLKGKSLKAARKAITKSGCRLGKVTGRGKVKRQKPKPGTQLPSGGKVNVKLG